MKRSEMIQNIASELVHEWTGFMPFSKAQQLAEIVLKRIEKDGMQPPTILWFSTGEYSPLKESNIFDDYDCDLQWEPEDED